MAQRKKSEIEFVQDTFCPQVAVLCSYDAEVVCRKNALTFVELVQPFCRFNGEIKITDPSNNVFTITNMRVEIKDVNHIAAPPSTFKKILDDAVLNGLSSAQSSFEKLVQTNNYELTANLNTPWFEAWREYFIKLGLPGDHEFFKSFLSCILVVSTGHLDPLDQFQKLMLQLQQLQQQSTPTSPTRTPKWFFPNLTNIYKYFVLLHDVHEGEISKAHQIYENMKNLYGSANCHLLQINSKSSAQSTTISSSSGGQTVVDFDPWLQYSKFNEMYNNSLMASQQSQSQPQQQQQQLEFDDNSVDSLLVRIDDELSNNQSQNQNQNQIAHPLNENSFPSSNDLKSVASNTSLNGSNQKRHGMCLAMSDHDRIKTFLSEFLQRGLVPYAERTIRILNEQIQSKKSILKSFNIPRRIFGGGSSSTSSASKSSTSSAANANLITVSTAGLSSSGANSGSASGMLTITNNFIQTNDDFQLRRLADLAFMFRLYDLAYNSYHTCKKDFSNYVGGGSASENPASMRMFLAGALEMASVANFMQTFAVSSLSESSGGLSSIPPSASTQSLSSINSNPSSTTSTTTVTTTTTSSMMLGSNSSKTFNSQYIDEAIQIYYNECKNIYFATRCVLLSTETLKATHAFLRAAFQFISLATDETDIRSALFLEQAALCYLAQAPQPWIRKYAFFMSLAGHRYNKAGQKKHSLRVYKHAIEIYENKQWFKVQDHINFMMSRLSYNLKNVNDALKHVSNIVVKKVAVSPSSLKALQASAAAAQQHPGAPVVKHASHQHQYQNLVEFANELNILRDFVLYCNTLIGRGEFVSGGGVSSSVPNLPLLSLPIVDLASIEVNLNPSDESALRFGHVLVNCENSTELIHNPGSIGDKSVKSFVDTSSTISTVSSSSSKPHHQSNAELREMWLRFEETLYMRTFGSLPVLFKPQVAHLTRLTDNKHMPKVVVDEWTSVAFNIRNTLRIGVTLLELTLLWKYVEQQHNSGSGDEAKPPETIEVSNEFEPNAEFAECSSIGEVAMSPGDVCRVRLKLRAKRPHGHLHVLGVKYKLCLGENVKLAHLLERMSLNSAASNVPQAFTPNLDKELISGKQLFELRGPRLNNNQQNMKSIVYDVDNRLNLKIINKTSLMQIEFDRLPTTLSCNQLERIKVYLVNTSSEYPIGSIKIATNGLTTCEICFSDPNSPNQTNTTTTHSSPSKVLKKSDFKYKDDASSSSNQSEDNQNESKFQPMAPSALSVANKAEFVYSLDENLTIEPNGYRVIDMWLKAPETEGEHKFYFMFFYQECLPVTSEHHDESAHKHYAHSHSHHGHHAKRKASMSQNLKY